VADAVRQRPAAIEAVPVRHVGRWVAAVVVLAIAAEILYTLATAPNLKWSVVSHYLSHRLILQGIVTTLQLTVLAMVIGIVLGAVLAVMRLSPNPVMSTVSWFYICLLYTSPSPRDLSTSRMPSSA